MRLASKVAWVSSYDVIRVLLGIVNSVGIGAWLVQQPGASGVCVGLRLGRGVVKVRSVLREPPLGELFGLVAGAALDAVAKEPPKLGPFKGCKSHVYDQVMVA